MLTHLTYMKQTALVFLILFLNVFYLPAQKLEGAYSREGNTFYPKDNNILVAEFGEGGLASFMIKGKNPFVEEDNRVGFIDTTGKIVIKPDYANCSKFKNERAIVELKKHNRQNIFGVIDRKGHLVIPVKFRYITGCMNGLLLLRNDSSISFVNRKGRVIVAFGKYTSYAIPHPVYMESTDDVGHMDFRWNMLYFDYNLKFNKYIGVANHKKWAIIDSNGRDILRPTFDGMESFMGNIAPAKVGSKFGVTDLKGYLIIPAQYDEIMLTGANYISVRSGNKTGVLSLANKTIVPMRYEQVAPFGTGFTAFDLENNMTLFDADGNQICGPVFRNYNYLNFPVWGDGRGSFFVFNSTDGKFHSCQDISYLNFPNNLIAVKRNDKWGIINGEGKTVLNENYDDIVAKGGTLIVERNDRYGLFNDKLEQLTRVKYDSIIIIKPLEAYDRIHARRNVYERARIGNKWGLVDSAGIEIIPFKYDELFWVFHNVVLSKNDGKYGLLNTSGKLIADFVYDEIKFSDGNFDPYNPTNNLIARKDGLYGLIDFTGKTILPFIYHQIRYQYGKLITTL